MDFETVSADEFGRSLSGFGVNLLTGNVRALAGFLVDVFGVSVHRLTDDFAIVTHDGGIMQLHFDGTYHSHPLLGVLPENPPRGAGLQLYLLNNDPDAAAAKAAELGHVVLEAPADKPHGLRECTILSPDGYAFSPAVKLG